MPEHCKRKNGTLRAWFVTRADAEAFASDPANPAYHGDIAHFCGCGFWHLSKVEWLFSEWGTVQENAWRN